MPNPDVRRDFQQLEALEAELRYGPFQEFYANEPRDFYIAGLIESSQDGEFGELFSTIIVEQFLRLRNADPVWYENGQFDEATKELIDRTSFADIIILTTDVELFELQPNVFITTGANCRRQLDNNFSQSCPDEFAKVAEFSEVAFSLIVLILLMIPSLILAAMIALTSSKKIVAKQFEAKRRQSRSLSLVVFENPMYTNSFSVIEIQGGPGFTDQAITCILEPFRIRILINKPGMTMTF